MPRWSGSFRCGGGQVATQCGERTVQGLLHAGEAVTVALFSDAHGPGAVLALECVVAHPGIESEEDQPWLAMDSP